MVKIIQYNSDYHKAHQTFASAYFGRRRKRINSDYIEWKFGGLNPEAGVSFLLAVDGEKVVGQFGLVPCEIIVGEKMFPAQWACDLMVDTNYRGKGIANLLYEEALSRKLTLGSDPSPAANKSLQRAGFIPIEAPWKFFLPLKMSAITKKKFKNLTPLIGNIGNPFLMITDGLRRFKSLQEIEISAINWEDVNKLGNNKSVRVLHDAAFLTWRFGSFKDYQSQGAVFQEEGKYYVTVRYSREACLVEDFLHGSIADAERVLRYLIKISRKKKLEEIRIMTLSTSLMKLLKTLGFFKICNAYDYYFLFT